jgi:hypothetical protein
MPVRLSSVRMWARRSSHTLRPWTSRRPLLAGGAAETETVTWGSRPPSRDHNFPILIACAGSGPCGASAVTFRPVTPRAEHESRRALRFGNA